MRHIAVSALALLVIIPAWADARLPVVNVAAAGVSARAAFGETIATTPVKQAAAPVKQNKKVVARTAKKTTLVTPASTTTKTIAADAGEQIVARADVLVPRRPSSDLWAHTTDAPLRMPDVSEFAVMRSDAILPEEDIDAPAQTVVARPRANVVASAPVAQAKPMAEIDNQIARLNELQKRADSSVDTSRTVASRNADINIHSDFVSTPIAKKSEPVKSQPITLSQMVVPMDNDVVVRAVEKTESPRIAAVRDDMTKMTPTELRRAFRKTFLSENKHLSTYQMDNRFDVISDMDTTTTSFNTTRDLSETGGIRPLEIKIKFRDDDSALSRDNYNLLSEYAGIVSSNPTRAVQVGIPQAVTTDSDARKLAARRLAIVEQVLRDNGISEQRILPVLSQRDTDGFVLRMISNDQYETLTQKRRDMFGDTVSKKTYKSMSW